MILSLRLTGNSLYDCNKARINKEREEIERLMDGKKNEDGTWMTADEAFENGFVDEVVFINEVHTYKERLQEIINAAPSGMVEAQYRVNEIFMQRKLDSLNKINSSLEVSNSSLSSQLNTEKRQTRLLQDKVHELQLEVDHFKAGEKERNDLEVGELLDKAIKDGCISQDSRRVWKNLLDSNFDETKQILSGLKNQNHVGKLSSHIKPARNALEELDAGLDDLPSISNLMSELSLPH